VSPRVVTVAGRRLPLSNLEKVFYPATGFTKAHTLDYYRRVADVILPHLRDRAVTMKRYPEGVDAPYFFEKRCPPRRPAWVKTARVPPRGAGEPMTACLVNDLETLIWVQNLASIELHVPLARAASPATPDALVFDLDPGEGAGILDCARVALITRDLLSRLKLLGWAKSSGKKGLHVYVPLNRAGTTFEDTREFARGVAQILEKEHPALVTSKMAKESRTGRVFINWSQNGASMTMVCVYSLRADKEPAVSFPLSWKELEDADRKDSPGTLRVLHEEAAGRIEKAGDLFGEVLRKKQAIPHF